MKTLGQKKRKDKLLIIGAGKVGTATNISLGNIADYHDPYKNIVNDDFNSYEYAIVCVDSVKDGPDDYKDLESVLDNLHKENYSGAVVIRSTVSPRKIEEWDKRYSFKYIMFPEFMPQQEGRLITDSTWAVVLGGDPQATHKFAAKLYSSGYPGEREIYRHVSKEEACIIKLADNAGLSAKLTYFNAVYKICEKFGASYEAVRNVIGMDDRIGIQHSVVPSPDDGKFGFGGHCLPKDIKAIAEMDELKFFQTVSKINDNLRNL
jgi:UDP-glucose 6-dehydrogenase